MNIFSVLSMGKSRLHETSMSAMLAYLINPNQDHGLGYKFLKSFLELANERKIYDDYLQKLQRGELKFDINLEVPYSSNNKRSDIDVQIKICDSKWNESHRIIIENKIKSAAANPKQLAEYYNAVLNDKENDDVFELDAKNLSVIFLTPDLNHENLKAEFENLNIGDNKVWLYWNSSDENKNTIVKLIQSILDLEQKAQISPINEYMRHTLKAFAYFVNQTIYLSLGKNRVGEDIGEIKYQKHIIINTEQYEIILRNSGQIQLLNGDGEKVQARPLLIKFLEEHRLPVNPKCPTTRCYGKQVFDFLANQK